MKKVKPLLALLAIGLLCVAAGVRYFQATQLHAEAPTSEPAASQPSITTTLHGQRFNFDVVDTEENRDRGLMFVRSMPADHGMLFVFDAEAPQTFWMKNTLIPLDVIYLDGTGKVTSILTMTPEPGVADDQLRRYPSNDAIRFAIEVNAGTAEKVGLKPGDQITLPAQVLKPVSP